MKILVLDAGVNAGRAIVQSLGAAGHRCLVAAPTTLAPAFASRWAKWRAVHPDPLDDKAAFQRWVLDRQHEDRFDLVLPVTEQTLVPLHEIRSDPALAGVLAIPGPEAVDEAFDKEKLRRRAESFGIPVPETVLAVSAADLDDPRIDAWLSAGPVVIKSTRSRVWFGPRGRAFAVHLARTRDELERHARALVASTALQVQRWVPGRGVGVELLARHGEIALSFAHERIHEVPLSGGPSSYRRSIAPPLDLMRASEALMRSFDWHGVAMVEFRVDAATGRFWLMEINGRFWGSLPLAIFAGVDFPRALVEMLGQGRDPQRATASVGVYARNLSLEVSWIKEILLKDGSLAKKVTRIAPSLLEWGRVFGGRETWDGASLRDPGPLAREVAGIVEHEVISMWRRVDRALLLRKARRTSRRRLKELASVRRVLVACLGNINRSPYVEFRLRSLVGPHVELRSRGLYPVHGRATPEPVLSAALRRGVDMSMHRSAVVEPADLAWADVVLVMDAGNHAGIAEISPASVDKIIWIGAFDGAPSVEIDDPIDLAPAEVDAVLARLDACVERFAADLAGRGDSIELG